MAQKSMHFPLDAATIRDLEPLRVGRLDELDTCVNSLVNSHSNVFIYGARGVGKTFLTRLIFKSLQQRDDLLALEISISNSYAAVGPGLDGAFPRMVLLQLCSELWRQRFGRTALELHTYVDASRYSLRVRTLSKIERTIVSVYRLLVRRDHSVDYKKRNKLGMSALFQTDIEEAEETKFSRLNLLHFEFADLLSDLQHQLAAEGAIARVVAICDEANLLPKDVQSLFLQDYLHLFLRRQLQFVFVAGNFAWATEESIPTAFDTILELKGFSEPSLIAEMIKKAGGPEIDLAATSLLQKTFLGNPRHIFICLHGHLGRPANHFPNNDPITAEELRPAIAETQRLLKGFERSLPKGMKA